MCCTGPVSAPFAIHQKATMDPTRNAYSSSKPEIAAVLGELTDQCLKATFFETGEHARWHPEITKEKIDVEMTSARTPGRNGH
jgi:hypothetical protein